MCDGHLSIGSQREITDVRYGIGATINELVVGGTREQMSVLLQINALQYLHEAGCLEGRV